MDAVRALLLTGLWGTQGVDGGAVDAFLVARAVVDVVVDECLVCGVVVVAAAGLLLL